MEKVTHDGSEDIIEALKELADKLNEIIDWINTQ